MFVLTRVQAYLMKIAFARSVNFSTPSVTSQVSDLINVQSVEVKELPVGVF